MMCTSILLNRQLYLALTLVVLISACSTENSQNSNGASNVASAESLDVASEMDETKEAELLGEPEETLSDIGMEGEPIRLLYLGDSITAGFGLGEEQAFPALAQKKAEQAGFRTITVNAGVSGDTSTGGLNRINWLLKNRVDILILELGGNDGLRGVDLTLTEANLSAIIEKTKTAWPNVEIVVAGMMVPPNLGHEYTEAFRNMFPKVASRYNATLIPFVLEGVGGIRELNQPDGIHPTAEGHKLVAETVWNVIEPLLESRQDS